MTNYGGKNGKSRDSPTSKRDPAYGETYKSNQSEIFQSKWQRSNLTEFTFRSEPLEPVIRSGYIIVYIVYIGYIIVFISR